MKTYASIFCIILGGMLMAATGDFPDWGDANSPANSHLSPYYLQNALHDAETPNVVTVVLGDYRGFDTMLETAVVLIAGLAVGIILRRSRDSDYLPETEEPASRPGLVVQNTARLLVPPSLIFGLYVLAHGHHSPGGGFQAGVIFGAVFIFYSFAFGLKETENWFSERAQWLCIFVGVSIYGGIGLLCLALQRNFLDYGALAAIIPVSEPAARSLAILGIETGVALTVMGAMFSIYANLASSGYHEKAL